MKNITAKETLELYNILSQAAIRGLKPASAIQTFELIAELKKFSTAIKEAAVAKMKEFNVDPEEWPQILESEDVKKKEIGKKLLLYFTEQDAINIDYKERKWPFEYITEDEFFKFTEARTIEDVVKGDDGKVVKIKRELEYSGYEVSLLYKFLCKKKKAS